MRQVIPALIQDDPEFATKASLVLIHDGGGATIKYYFLDDLDRPVWGIANEGLAEEGAWPGGIKQLAKTYVDTILPELQPGPIILGGWSVGGLVAFEMATLLAQNHEFPLLGVIMIDTFHPSASIVGTSPDAAAIEWGEATTQESKEVTMKSIENCGRFAQRWAQDSPVNASTIQELPPIILLRASGSDATVEQGPTGATQEERSLGWQKQEKDFFSRILEFPGDHYNLFSDQNVGSLSQSLAKACSHLEDNRGL